MLAAYTVDQVRAAEQRASAEVGEPELMRRAARGLADHLGFIDAGETVLALVGRGSNGGDALFAAAHLLDRGVHVDVCLLDPDTVHGPGLEAALAAGARVVDRPTGQRWVLDAIVGIGGRPGLSGLAAEWLDWIDETGPFVVAVDVPSGVEVDGATSPARHVQADLTVTFGLIKVAGLVGPAADAGGDELPFLIPLGLDGGPPAVRAIEAGDCHLFPTPGLDAHKYTRGVVGVVAGSDQYAGAAHLTVAGAQAGPVGMVRFAGEADLARRVVDRAPEVVASPGRVQAWVVGPGGADDVGELLHAVLTEGVPVVVDAAALDHLPDRFVAPALLTPHAGELGRLLGVPREEVEADPLRVARAAAEQWNATVLLKGRRTLVVAPGGGPTWVNLSGTAWLGTAGAGDVLAGFAGSLLAAGLPADEAGALAAFLHGAAAVRASGGGPITASDVAAALPGTVTAFLSGELTEVRAW